MSEQVDTGEKKLRWVGTRPVRPDGVDKVTGHAAYGADLSLPGMLTGRVLRSPHAHARIVRLDTSKAAALDGVKAVITAADFPDLASETATGGEQDSDYRDMSLNLMARDKVVYDGHAIAAVAAVTPTIADRAIDLVEVEYEKLPHVLDPLAAMASDAPLIHDDLFTAGVEPKPERPSNVAKKVVIGEGDPEAGFAKADIVVEHDFVTEAVHQGYIEPHACVVSTSADGHANVFASSQGHFMIRAYCAKLLGMELSQIRVQPAEIGGGFGGKTTVYLEPLAILLSRKSGRPVKMVMSRGEVFRATGPTSPSAIKVKIGATRDGRLTGAWAELVYGAGGFAGSAVQAGAMTIFAPYDIDEVKVEGYDVIVNRPKSAAYRAPGAPMAAFAVETVMDEIAETLKIDPIDLRLRNAAKKGTRAPYGPRFREIGFEQTLEAARSHPHYEAPLGPNQGRGVASGFWFNGGSQSTASVNINEDGTAAMTVGSPDIGGSRASLAQMAAEELGIPFDCVDPIIADTASVGYNDVTGGSRVTFATGMAVIEACREIVAELKRRAAAIWESEPELVEWAEGEARYTGNGGGKDPIPLAELARKAPRMGGPLTATHSLAARGVGPAFGTHICDVEVDEETGHVQVVRYTAVQDAGRAVHPSYVEGQMQGGVAQGIGWALNEAYMYDDEGRLENPSFLDYRMPVASDLPMIDTVIVEVPNPKHPYGVRGVGEVPIVPPLAAVANAVYAATGCRMRKLPMSPPAVLAELDERSL